MSLLGLIGHIRVSGFFLGSDRQVKPEAEDFELGELVPEHVCVLTVSHAGYVKRLPLDTYRTQGRGGVGMDIHLDKVPTRQAGMQPFEILLSESQERMLIVVKKGEEEVVNRIFEKWDLHAVHIGDVTEGTRSAIS